MNTQQLNGELGNIDLYLLDQLLKGQIPKGQNILDAGCGEGRNLIYFLNNGFDCYGVDQNEDAIRMLHFILGSKYSQVSKANFQLAQLENLPFQNGEFGFLICSAVLHFANDKVHFQEMFHELVRVTQTHGIIFIRCASDIGLVGHESIGNGQYKLPDGSIRYLISNESISELKRDFKLSEVEPVKTVVVEKKRSMTTLVLKKEGS